MKNNYKIESWYDKQTRCWVTQVLDSEGNQVGEASYDPTKKSRDISIKMMKQENIK